MITSLKINKHTLFVLTVLFWVIGLRELSNGNLFPLFVAVILVLIYSIRFSLSELKVLFIIVPLLCFFSLIPSADPGSAVTWKYFRNDDVILKLSSGKKIVANEDCLEIGDVVDFKGNLLEKGNPFKTAIPRFRFEIYQRCAEKIPYPVSEVVSAMTIGVRDQVPDSIKAYMILNGTYHYFAISGLHIGVVISVFYLLFKTLRIRFPLFKSSLATGILLPFTGLPPSALRAFFFSSVVSLGKAVGRKVDLMYVTVLTALLFAAFSNLSTGAILSFLAVTGILVALTFNKHRSILAFTFPFLFTLPYVALKFGTFNLLSPVNSLILFPLIYIVLLTSLVAEITMFSVPPINTLLTYLVRLVVELSKIQYIFTKPFIVHVNIPEIYVMLFYVFALMMLVFENRKALIFTFSIFLISTILFKVKIHGEEIVLDGKTLNSCRFITSKGQELEKCKIYSNFVLPFSRKLLKDNEIYDLRSREGELPTQIEAHQQ